MAISIRAHPPTRRKCTVVPRFGTLRRYHAVVLVVRAERGVGTFRRYHFWPVTAADDTVSVLLKGRFWACSKQVRSASFASFFFSVWPSSVCSWLIESSQSPVWRSLVSLSREHVFVTGGECSGS